MLIWVVNSMNHFDLEEGELAPEEEGGVEPDAEAHLSAFSLKTFYHLSNAHKWNSKPVTLTMSMWSRKKPATLSSNISNASGVIGIVRRSR